MDDEYAFPRFPSNALPMGHTLTLRNLATVGDLPLLVRLPEYQQIKRAPLFTGALYATFSIQTQSENYLRGILETSINPEPLLIPHIHTDC